MKKLTISRPPMSILPLHDDHRAEFPHVSRETWDRLECFVQLLEQWNAHINLMSPLGMRHIWERHVLDALELLQYIPDDGSPILTDVGSGAGFPGMVLAIAGIKSVHLIESIRKKAAFLRAASLYSPYKVHVHAARVETIIPWKTTIITCRAVGNVLSIMDMVQNFLRPNVMLLFPRGDIQQAKKDRDALLKQQPMWHIDVHPTKRHPRAAVMQLSYHGVDNDC